MQTSPSEESEAVAVTAVTARPSREEQAVREIGHTDFSPGTVRFLMLTFCLTILFVPLIQQLHELRQNHSGGRSVALPKAWSIGACLPNAMRVFWNANTSILDRCLAATDSLHYDIKRYEDALEDESIVARSILPVVQSVLAALLGAGNEKAYLGRDRWLFYRPDIDYVTGRGFMQARQLKKRSHSGDRWTSAPQPDPIPAILQFKDQLAERGIALILMPVPPKSVIHPEKFFHVPSPTRESMQNPSYAQFKHELVNRGIPLFDPTDALLAWKSDRRKPQYLDTDTHWMPEAVEYVADRLKAFIEEHVTLPSRDTLRMTTLSGSVTNLGDIAVMLQLPPEQSLFSPQRVELRQILSHQHELWRADRGADILVLGDSFANIYSLTAMGWGESAGLVEQLSYRLQRPIDCILRNDDGAYATRQMISRELGQGKDRLSGKRLVIWQFAMRELAFGDWKLLDMKLGQPPSRRFLVLPSGQEMRVSGVIESVSAVPKPRSVPYKDHILALHLTDVLDGSGRAPGGDVVVYLWSMRDNVWTAAAGFRPGQKVRLNLKPWSDVSDKLERINRSELSDESLQLEEPAWGEVLNQ